MDRIFYQLTVLTVATCVSVIGLSTLFPSHRRADLEGLSPKGSNLQVQIIDY